MLIGKLLNSNAVVCWKILIFHINHLNTQLQLLLRSLCGILKLILRFSKSLCPCLIYYRNIAKLIILHIVLYGYETLSVTARGVIEYGNKVPRKIVWPEWKES
jgi:hypothetical protein